MSKKDTNLHKSTNDSFAILQFSQQEHQANRFNPKRVYLNRKGKGLHSSIRSFNSSILDLSPIYLNEICQRFDIPVSYSKEELEYFIKLNKLLSWIPTYQPKRFSKDEPIDTILKHILSTLDAHFNHSWQLDENSSDEPIIESVKYYDILPLGFLDFSAIHKHEESEKRIVRLAYNLLHKMGFTSSHESVNGLMIIEEDDDAQIQYYLEGRYEDLSQSKIERFTKSIKASLSETAIELISLRYQDSDELNSEIQFAKQFIQTNQSNALSEWIQIVLNLNSENLYLPNLCRSEYEEEYIVPPTEYLQLIWKRQSSFSTMIFSLLDAEIMQSGAAPLTDRAVLHSSGYLPFYEKDFSQQISKVMRFNLINLRWQDN